MLTYLIGGIALGAIYALVAAGITVSYRSSGIFNFAFGSIAFFVARFYYFLHVDHRWPIWISGGLCILVISPMVGFFLWLSVLRLLRRATILTKVVSTIGIAVAVPAVADLVFGNEVISYAPGLAPEPVRVFDILGATVTLNQVIAVVCVAVLALVGTVVMRFTLAGILVRSMVDSEAMTSLSGANPTVVSIWVWTVTTAIAGLVGILEAPLVGLTNSTFQFVVAAAFAGVVIANLRNAAVAAAAGIAVGLLTGVIQGSLPPTSSWTAALISGLPFALIFLFLIYSMRPGAARSETRSIGIIDEALLPIGGLALPGQSQTADVWRRVFQAGRQSAADDEVRQTAAEPPASLESRVDQPSRKSPASVVRGIRSRGWLGSLFILAFVAFLPLVLNPFWLGLLAQGIAFGVAFLAITLVTGEGGMIWLCQISLAGFGAITAAYMAGHGIPVTAAVLLGALATVPLGLIIGALTIRLGDLYVTLATLTFALLMERLIFPLDVFFQSGTGLAFNPPGWINSNLRFAYASLIVFCVLAALIMNFRRSTTGLAMVAARESDAGARAIGLSTLWLKVVISGLAAFIAGLGGCLLALYGGVALSSSFGTLEGLVWLAVLVTLGVRSNIAALAAGIVYTVFPGLVQDYLPPSSSELSIALFGLGAVLVAKNPDGVVIMYARQLRAVATYLVAFAGRAVSRTARARTALAPNVSRGQVPAASTASKAPKSASLIAKAAPGGWNVGSVISSNGAAKREELADVAPTALEVLGVSVRFGGIDALTDASISAERGEITGLIGPNGAGKSTLLGAVSGLVRPQTGSVLVGGRDVTNAPPERRARAGVARTFQHPELFGTLTVREHVLLAHRVREQPTRVLGDLLTLGGFRRSSQAEQDNVDKLLEFLNLQDVATREVKSLPLGLARLAEVARAIATRPSVLLLDEPSSGLDATETSRLMGVLDVLVEQLDVAIVLVEHDLEMVFTLCRRLYVLDFGHVINCGTPNEVRRDERVRKAYIGEVAVDVPGLEN